MDLGIAGKTALVTASSRGLGLATASALAAEGVRVAICARDEARLLEAAAEILASIGATVELFRADVRNPVEIRGVVAAATARFGAIDICVANAGGPPAKPFLDTTAEEWQAAIDANLMSAVHLARAVLPGMCERGWGRFLAITSASVKQPIDQLVLSNSVRAAVSGLIKTLSNECAPFNVLVNGICPGYTATARLDSLAQRDPDLRAKWLSQIPMKRFGNPEEFGAVAAFLCSERAGYVTGVNLLVDGGFVKGL